MLKSKFFKKSILLNTIIFTVPFVAISLLFAFHYLGVLRSSVTENQKMTLAISDNYINNQTEKLDYIVSEINYNSYFDRITTGESLTMFDSISSILQASSMSHVFDNIYVYFLNEQFLYSDSTSCSLTFFANNMYNYNPYYSNTFYQYLNSITTPVIIPASNIDRDHPDDRYVTFFYPIYSKGEQIGVMFFMLNEAKFDITTENTDEKYLLLDNNNLLITKSSSITASDANLLQNYVKNKQNNDQVITLNGKSYFQTYTYASSGKNFRYVLLVPYKDAFSSVEKSLAFFLLAIMVLTALGGVLIYFLTRYNYQPIRTLINKSCGIISDRHLNEVDVVSQTIDFLQESNTVLKSRLEHYRKYLLLNLLRENNSDEQSLRNDCDSIGIVFDKPYFQIVTVQMFTGEIKPIEVNARLSSMIEQSSIYYVDTLDGHSTLIINTENRKGLTCENVRAIREYFYELDDRKTNLCVAAGKAVDSMINICKSYMQAMIAARYQTQTYAEKKSEIFYSNIPHNYLEKLIVEDCENSPESGIEKSKKKLDKDELIQYVSNNCLSYSFSLQKMAEYFDVNMSYLSQSFNTCVGKTINDYATCIKINKAQGLLVTTDYSIAKISNLTGYSNVSSFIRRFKQVCGVTPGEYRNQNGQNV